MLRIYLTIGITAIFGLIVLGVTSTDGMIKRMGAIPWNRLHRIIYVVGFLGFLHYYMQAKLDVTEPVLYSGLFLWLMEYRVMAKLGWKQGLVPLLVLSLVAALSTALVEAAWYQVIRPGIGARVDPCQLRLQHRASPRVVGADRRSLRDRRVRGLAASEGLVVAQARAPGAPSARVIARKDSPGRDGRPHWRVAAGPQFRAKSDDKMLGGSVPNIVGPAAVESILPRACGHTYI